ncbi:Hypothetical protein I595_2257 [Croceitalea dokdonensis DOKDO 023]|uniref:Secretion system C-terminal sorting domain-containing protein n=1 Tax=Croceitalea dokdonensis DOKDO 023 TaxID=1300341 RepID=A0A0P7A5C0_9FLAO|nr:hypothetical protein [Croceitalea dokdonensis]KPM31762.1 Hypothetical protein I595_2257 [Croceitalea dokdonensis DOKDO 023]
MKTIMKNTVLAALMFTTVVGLAKEPVSTFGKKAFEVEKKLVHINTDPVFTQKGQKVFVNLLNLDQENVVVKIYDSEGRVVFKEVFKGEMIVEKAFNFEKAYKDNYTVVVIDNDKKFTEKIEVK